VTRPGLVKAREPPLVVACNKLVLRTFERRWRELLDRADVISEGSVRNEATGRMWYGSTSVVLPAQSGDVRLLVALAERDPHLRLRAMRTAWREAALRAPVRIGRLVCEVSISPHAGSVRIDVDVQAPLIERHGSQRRAR
jgi:hypothetical protein